MNARGQYRTNGHNRTYVGASLVHTLELKQRYDNVNTAAAASLLSQLSQSGKAAAIGENRWDVALKDGAWVRLIWYPDWRALEVTISDRELRRVEEMDTVRRRYEVILDKITPLLRTRGATTVGAATYAGQQVQAQPRFAARTRAIKAVFDMYTQARTPYYLYAEVNGMVDKRSASTVDEANALFAALEKAAGEVYVAIFDSTDPLWPGPAFDVYHAAPQVPQDRPVIARSYVGQGSIFGHTPTDVEGELDQLHGELMCFGQEVIELTKPLEASARTSVQKLRDEELAASKIVQSFQPQLNEVYRIEKLLNEAGVSKKVTEVWREQSIPPYADILAVSTGKAEPIKQQFLAAKKALDDVMPKAQRLAAVKRSRELSDQRAEAEGKVLAESPSPLLQWNRSVWTPFFDGWQRFRSEKKDIPLQTWPLSGTWDRIQDYRRQWVDLRKNAPFKSKCPTPLDPDRKDPSITGIFGDVGNILKWGVIGALGIGAVVALSSVVSSVRKGRDPAEKYVEMIRESRRSRASRPLPEGRTQLALPPGRATEGE